MVFSKIVAGWHSLPVWSAWGLALALIPAIFLVGWGLSAFSALVSLVRFRVPAEAHWTERARLAYPLRIAVKANRVLLPILTAPIGFIAARVLGLPWAIPIAIYAISAYASTVPVGRFIERRIRRSALNYGTLREQACGWLILIVNVVLWLGLLNAMPWQWGVGAFVVLGIGAGLLAFSVLGGWLLVLRRLGVARPASSRLAAVVEAAVARVKVRPKAVFEITTPIVNAVAYPSAGYLVFTDSILAELDDAELTAITAHELGHLSENRLVKFARIIRVYLLLALLALVPLSMTYGVSVLLVVAVLPLLIALLHRIARRMELRSDAFGLTHEGEKGTYPRALEKIYRANLVAAVLPKGRQVHPHLYDRLVAAGAEPTYARPLPPPSGSGLAGIPVFVLIALSTLVFLPIFEVDRFQAPSYTLPAAAKPDSRALILFRRAMILQSRGDTEGAARRLRQASEIDRTSPLFPNYLAVILASSGRCEEATQALDEARRRSAAVSAARADPMLESVKRAVEACSGSKAAESNRRQAHGIGTTASD
jgi:Zn-dependent protease with chaperone function